jgi:hypothetical protein
MDSKTAAAVAEKEVLWRVNFEEFLRKLRHQVISLNPFFFSLQMVLFFAV